MQRKKLGVDIILDVLKQTLVENPTSTFVTSLLHQYQERGGLSKKQLEGLYNKALKVESIPPAKLATMEAIILKKPMKHKSPQPQPTPIFEKDIAVGEIIKKILDKYPQHKRVVFLNNKYQNNQPLAITEVEELNKFLKVLFK